MRRRARRRAWRNGTKCLIVTGGQCHDSTQARALLTGFTAAYVLADKGYDSQALIEGLGASPVIPSRAVRIQPRPVLLKAGRPIGETGGGGLRRFAPGR